MNIYVIQSVIHLPDYGKLSFPDTPAVDLSALLPMVPPQDLAFVQEMLQLEPASRLTAAQVHEYLVNNANHSVKSDGISGITT